MHRLAVIGGLISLMHTIVANNASDPQPVVGKDPIPAGMLCLSMLCHVSPLSDGLLVTPE